jgi:hypothetical protein
MYNTEALSDRQLHRLATEHGIAEGYLDSWWTGVWKSTDDGRLVLPILDFDERERGHEVKQLKPYIDALPKALIYKEAEYHGMSIYHVQDEVHTRPYVIVEDSLSAARLASTGVANGISLIGTGISWERATDIRTHLRGRGFVYIALDADAAEQMHRLVRMHYTALPMRPITLTKDIKDMDTEEYTVFTGQILTT